MISPSDLEYLKKRKEELIDNCPICQGRGAFCQCQYAFQFEYTKIHANIPRSLRTYELTDIVNPKLAYAVKYAQSFIATYKTQPNLPNLIISGMYDRPTQILAVHILTQILKMKKTGYYFASVFDAKTAAAKNWSPKEKKDTDCVALNTYDVIVIDGFGTGNDVNSTAYDELREVIKTRSANEKLTVFVSRCEFSLLSSQEKIMVGACKCTELSCHKFDVTPTPSTPYIAPTMVGMDGSVTEIAAPVAEPEPEPQQSAEPKQIGLPRPSMTVPFKTAILNVHKKKAKKKKSTGKKTK